MDILKTVLKGFWLHVQNSYFVEQLSMVAYDNIMREKQYVLFRQILIPSEKPAYAPVYPFLINTKKWKFFQTICCKLSIT